MPNPWDEKWTQGEDLGSGGQGKTVAVTYKMDPTIKGALKYLKNNLNLQARGRIRREVVNLQSLANSGGSVPRVLDHNTELPTSQDGSPVKDTKQLFLVMDLIPGDTVAARIAGSPSNSKREPSPWTSTKRFGTWKMPECPPSKCCASRSKPETGIPTSPRSTRSSETLSASRTRPARR